MFLVVTQEASSDSGFPDAMQWSQEDLIDQTDSPKESIPITILPLKIIFSMLGVSSNLQNMILLYLKISTWNSYNSETYRNIVSVFY